MPPMDTRKILAELRAERTRIDQAIAAIESLGTGSKGARRGPATSSSQSAPQKPHRRRRLTAAGRKRLSEMMKARWAERKKKAKTA